MENIQINPKYFSPESLPPSKSNPTKHDGFNIAFGVVGPVEEEAFQGKTLPFPTFYKG